jgi:hypothetical protein
LPNRQVLMPTGIPVTVSLRIEKDPLKYAFPV